MRVFNLAQHLDLVPLTRGPHRGNEIAEAVDRQQRRALKRRHKETAREMRQVVLDVVELGAQRFLRNAKHTREFFAQIAHLRGIRESSSCLSQQTQTLCGIEDLLVQVR